ncbi:Endonuclease-like protein [Elsinoe fawcettii]|nr:Endonuclease-like protein [Elsinoe fawcettii]
MPWIDYIWTRSRSDNTTSSTSLLPSSEPSSAPPSQPLLRLESALEQYSSLTGLPLHIILPTAILTALSLGSITLYKSRLRRIPDAAHIPPSFFRRRSLYGYVPSVGDGDNFRLFHTPGGRLAGWGWLPSRRQFLLPAPGTTAQAKESGKAEKGHGKQKLETIHVRIAGVDAPELAHFGRPSQPHGHESLEILRELVLGRYVRVYLYRRDQYERVVAGAFVRTPMPVLIRPITGLLETAPIVLRLALSPVEVVLRMLGWTWNTLRGRRMTDVAMRMLEEGAAGVYEAKFGSEFGGEKKEQLYRDAEAEAKRRGIGMWGGKGASTDDKGWWSKVFGGRQAATKVETPREFKTRMKGADESEVKK